MLKHDKSFLSHMINRNLLSIRSHLVIKTILYQYKLRVFLGIPRSCPLKWKYTLQLLKQLRFSRNFRLTENFRDYYTIFYKINRTTIMLLTSCMFFGEVKYHASDTKVQFSPNYLFFIWPLPWFHFYYHPMPKWWTLGSHFLDFNIFLLVVITFLITVIHNMLQRDDNPNTTKRLTFWNYMLNIRLFQYCYIFYA